MNLMLVMHMHNIVHLHACIVHSTVTQSGKELIEYILEIHVPINLQHSECLFLNFAQKGANA